MTDLRPRPLTRAWLFLFATTCASFAGCSSPGATLARLAQEHDHQRVTLKTRPFLLQASVPTTSPVSTMPLRVYLEGDGRAWITPTQPSLDPTPRDSLLARLAMEDPQPSIYLARPCQYLNSPSCAPRYWTTARYSAEVLSSLDQALDQLKQRYANHQFEIIGYSGGGTLALLLATRRRDIAQVQTLAGNLSPRRWTELLELAPLPNALEPLDFVERLRELPQRHLTGIEDRVVPTRLLDEYASRLGPADCLELHRLAGVSHRAGWRERWPQWRDRPIECTTVPEPAAERAGAHSVGAP
jgi:pimeloyl-ACP methyl ester carboxylesterase